jgi:ubiquinone/menaquinone biosynthesis C-methylase UbiE
VNNKNQSKSTSFEKRWRDRFVEFANKFDDDAGIAGWSQSGLDTRFRFFKQNWKPDKPGSLWIDVGCGAGTYSRYLSSADLQVIGFDYSYPTIEKAKNRTAHPLFWGISDVKSLPLKYNSVDGALCFGVAQSLENIEPAIKELLSVLKPGGQLWIDGLNSWCVPNMWVIAQRKLKGLAPHLHYESPYTVRKIIKNYTKGSVKLYWLIILPTKLKIFQPLVEIPLVRKILTVLFPINLLFSHSFVFHIEAK